MPQKTTKPVLLTPHRTERKKTVSPFRKNRNVKANASYSFLAKEVGTAVRHFRIKKALTLKELSEKVNITVSFLSDIEHARTLPSIDTFVRLCHHLDIPPLLPKPPAEFLEEGNSVPKDQPEEQEL